MRTADVIADAVRELVAMHEVAAIGLGAAGFVDAARSTVMFAPNLAWRDEALGEAME
jgi:glucokinase